MLFGPAYCIAKTHQQTAAGAVPQISRGILWLYSVAFCTLRNTAVCSSLSHDRLLCWLCTVYHYTVLALDSDCIANEVSARRVGRWEESLLLPTVKLARHKGNSLTGV